MTDIRHDWSADEAYALLSGPLDSLVAKAKNLHQRYGAKDVQQCVLLSIKTGACPENCGYCSQSAHFETRLQQEPLVPVETVVAAAKEARQGGANRFCMGAAWRNVPPESDPRFERLLSMIRAVAAEGMEVCCTLGMATESQLVKMREAGLLAYNHNLDTSREYYPSVVTTRTFDDRLRTLQAARKAGVQLCSGGIIGLGEAPKDRAAMLAELARMNPHPESVPINLLVPIEGTRMEGNDAVPFEDFLRTVATARVLMPESRVRLSAGRNTLTEAQQLQCMAVGANSIFVGEKLLTTENVDPETDRALLKAKQETQASASV